jgi:nitronate monooxygenase
MRTWLTERFSLDVPVVGAPMAGVAGGRLAQAVSAAGGLGTVGIGSTPDPADVRRQLATAAEGGRPHGAGLMAWALERDDTVLGVVVEARPSLVSVSYGAYERFLTPLRDAGIAVTTQVGTVAELRRAEAAGVDAVVARGGEAGGHGRDDVSTLTLLQAALDTTGLPVLAAGGVATARGLAAVLAAGAAGAWVGTAFLACTEALTGHAARDRLLSADETGTAYGRVFDVAQRLGWPREYGGRALRNAFFDEWDGREAELAGDDEARARLLAARSAGDLDTAYVYAGQAVGLVRAERTAAEVMADLAGARDLLRKAAGLADPVS